MKSNDTRTLTPEALYECRKHAIRLYQEGMTRIKIAEIVGAHRNTVGEWISYWKANDSKVLKPKKAGRPKGSGKSLTVDMERTLKKAITDNTPDQLRFDFALWTRDAVRLLIDELYHIDMPIRTVGEYLKRWGFTPQKPVRRAFERSPKAVQKWLDETYPEIHQRSVKEDAEVHWGDETGLRSDDVNGRGYSPKGKTPVRPCKGTPERINMISSITNQGKVRFMFYDGSFNAARLIEFLTRILRESKKKVFMILDNLRVHHAKVVKAWVEENKERIELFYLPSYSPNLNPDEYLNNDLKTRVSKKPDKRFKGKLKETSLGAMRSIQKQPEKVRNYFMAEEIKYAA
jgi:transposase